MADLYRARLSGSQRAVKFVGVESLEVGDAPVPTIEDARDAIVRVRAAGICGSDLHLYFGREAFDAGTTMGHEIVGEVVAVGADAPQDLLGATVMCPFTTSCGDASCAACARGLSARCPQGRLLGYRLGGVGLHGGQAEFARVPLARGSLVRLPAGLRPEEGLLLGDIFSTGLFCAANAGLASPEGQGVLATAAQQLGAALGVAAEGAAPAAAAAAPPPVFVVVGCGPVGICAIFAALELLRVRAGVAEGDAAAPAPRARIFAVDNVASRLEGARRAGAEPLDLGAGAAAVRAAVLEASGAAGGAEAVLECVGANSALELAFACLRPGGVLSSIGVNTSPSFPFTPDDAYNKNVTFRSGRCPARSIMPLASVILRRLRARGVDVAAEVVTHRIGIEDAVDAYRNFASRAPGWGKVVIEFGAN